MREIEGTSCLSLDVILPPASNDALTATGKCTTSKCQISRATSTCTKPEPPIPSSVRDSQIKFTFRDASYPDGYHWVVFEIGDKIQSHEYGSDAQEYDQDPTVVHSKATEDERPQVK